jgi:hypothetical protein
MLMVVVLPAPLGPRSEDLAVLDLKGDIVDGGDVAEPLAEVGDFDGVHFF